MIKKTGCILFIGFLLLLSACGNDDEPSSEGATEPGVRQVVVAVPPTSKPLSWEENGELQGYEPGVIRLVDEELEDYEFEMVGVADSAAEVGLDTGKYDMIAQGLFKTAEREDKYLVPEESNGFSLMRIYANTMGDNVHINSMEDLVDKDIYHPTPSGGVFNFLMTWNEENPNYQIDFTPSDAAFSYADILKQVEAGRFDVFIHPSNVGQNEIIENENLDIRETEPVDVTPTYFMFHEEEENVELVEEVNSVLKELKESGELSELSVEYFDEDIFEYE
ncbi:transporter substrate-binding domain-containing protein [Oceanobacillus locisalsi]|uniref:Transporter substrate-binding domain-containing protein n=1 Tax=Oceanobacillus locisalsi TaxID=546107 RepID=A0ABW3NJK9_9BACI